MARSVADKVQTQHQLLKSQLSGALRALEGGQGADMADRVEHLARSLELHLTLEEEHYFPQARAAQPQLADALDELLLEHTELRSSLREAGELLAQGDVKAGGAMLKRYATMFRGHERREYDLLEKPASD